MEWRLDYYLNNKIVTAPEGRIKQLIPDLRDSLTKSPDYLKTSRTTYARIVMLKNYKDTLWREVATFDGYKNNWEGITLFKKGALVVSDANINKKQVTGLAYVEF